MDERQQFSIVPRFVWQGCSARAVRVYAALASHVDWETGECWPTRPTLAKALNTSLKTLDRALEELEAAGAIVKTRRRKASGDPDSNLYQLPFVINRRAVENAPGGSVTSDATWRQKRRQGRAKSVPLTRSSEREGLTSPKTDPADCAHLPADDEGYCTACGTNTREEHIA